MEKDKWELSDAELDTIQPYGENGKETTYELMSTQLQPAAMQVQADYITARMVQKPRNFQRFVDNVVKEAAMAGDKFVYGWAVRNKDGSQGKIEGGTIDLAMSMARNYENAAIDVQLVAESPSHFVLKGAFLDLETGFTCTRLFRQRKSQSLGKMDRDRQEDIVFQIAQSKAVRNAVFQALPDWVRDKAIEVAKGAAIKSIDGDKMADARTRVIAYFTQYGVAPQWLERYCAKKLQDWKADDIANLRQAANALKEGRVAPEELFPELIVSKPPEPKPEVKAEPPKPKKAEPEPIATVTGVADSIIKSFKFMKRPDFFLKFIRDNEDKIAGWPEAAQKELLDKHKRTFGQDYVIKQQGVEAKQDVSGYQDKLASFEKLLKGTSLGISTVLDYLEKVHDVKTKEDREEWLDNFLSVHPDELFKEFEPILEWAKQA